MDPKQVEYLINEARTHLFTTEERRASLIRDCRELAGKEYLYLPITRYIYKTRGFPSDYVKGFEMGIAFFEEMFNVPFEKVETDLFQNLFGEDFNPSSRKKF